MIRTSVLLTISILALITIPAGMSFAQMPPHPPMIPQDNPPQRMQERMPPRAQENMSDNFGIDVANFVRYAMQQFSQQRQETIDAIKQCRQQVADAASEDKNDVRKACRDNLDAIRDSYKDIRQTYLDTFSEFKTDIKTISDDAKGNSVGSKKNVDDAISRIAQNFASNPRMDGFHERIRMMMYSHPSDITNFDGCVAAGNAVMESYPRQCRTQDGRHFVEDVKGSQVSDSGLTITEQGEFMIISGNGIPDHQIGDFPNQYNPNTVSAQNYTFKIPLNPQIADSPTSLPMGPIGIALSGAAFFNPLTAYQEDAVVNEIFDGCSGHPTEHGLYHYHQLSSCFTDSATGHSKIFGYAFDGFAVYGPNGEEGYPPTDLDDCNGHVEGDYGYHYHTTEYFPYIIGCYMGTPENSNFR